ncbi:MAG: CobW family GTP-binding protein [Hyphomicrobiaceae bacterium]
MTPVSILTGFLGSGKTTILAHLMRDPALGDTAVIINEFGDVGLDHDLIESSDESLVTLQTGCLCCKIQGDLVATLNDLLARRAAGDIANFKRIVIETSGLADPAPILQGLMIDDALAGHIALARVVTVVDAANGQATLTRQPEARKQVAVADQLVMSKLDLADDGAAALRAAVTDINPTAPMQQVSHGALDPDLLFPKAARLSGAFDSAASLPPAQHDHHHHDDIATYAIVRERPIAAVALSLFLEALADHCGGDLLRLKGLVNVAENPSQPAVIHGVQHVFHAPVWLDAWPGEDNRTRIVLIVRGIDEAWVQALLHAIETEVRELDQARETATQATAQQSTGQIATRSTA